MKLKILTIAFIAGLSSCGGRTLNNHEAHSHDNCVEHNHEHDHSRHSNEIPTQESFKVGPDSCAFHEHEHNCNHKENNHKH